MQSADAHASPLRNHCGWWFSGVAFLIVGLVGGCSKSDSGVHIVSQKGRQFSEKSLDIAKGDTVRIINDDGNLRHHAYVKSDQFSFDSGDQEPGTTAEILFSKSGEFYILCGIHPKMKLAVHVK